MIRAYIAAAFLVAGAMVFLLSLLGVFRFGYVLNRLHASAVSDTLGTLCTVLGLILIFGWSWASLKLIVIVITMWISGPVCTNRIAAEELATSDEYKKHCREESKCKY